MFNNPFDFMTDQPDHDIAPKSKSEFSPLYLLALAAQDRRAKRERVWRNWLHALGSWLVSLGVRIKHTANPYVTGRHLSPRMVHLHRQRTRPRR